MDHSQGQIPQPVLLQNHMEEMKCICETYSKDSLNKAMRDLKQRSEAEVINEYVTLYNFKW